MMAVFSTTPDVLKPPKQSLNYEPLTTHQVRPNSSFDIKVFELYFVEIKVFESKT